MWARPSVPALTNRFLQTIQVKTLLIHVQNNHNHRLSVWSCHLWKGEQWIEWTGPLQGLKEKTAGAIRVTPCPLVGAAASVLEEKEHLSSRPPSEPTRKVSGSHGDRVREVTPTLLLPRACGQHTAVTVPEMFEK